MIEYNDMSEMLEADKNAMAFYNSLPISLQHKLYSRGVRAFAELYSAAGNRPGAVSVITSGEAASAAEYTGVVPSGGNINADERRSYGEVLPSETMPSAEL